MDQAVEGQSDMDRQLTDPCHWPIFGQLLLQAITLCLGLLLWPNPGSCNEKITIQLKWHHQFQFAGYYAAKDKGFYAREGLDVELRQHVPGRNPIEEVLLGRAQYGVADAGLLIERQQGKPVVLLAQILQHSPLVLVTRRDSGIRTAADLAGKRIMLETSGHNNMPLVAMLHNALGGLDGVQIQKHSLNPQDLIDGKTDAYASYITNQPHWYQLHNLAINIIDPHNYGIHFYGDNFFTTEQELNNHPERVEKVRRATLRGWQYAMENTEEIIDLILEKYNPKAFDRAHLKYEAQEIRKLISPDSIEIGSFNPTRHQKTIENFAEKGFVDKKTLDADFFYQARPSSPKIELTTKEKKWLANHPRITFGTDKEWAPYVIPNDGGSVSGLEADYIAKINALTGSNIQIVLGKWQEMVTKAKDHAIDGLALSAYHEERAPYFNFTDSTYSTSKGVYTHKSLFSKIKGLRDLAGKRVAFQKGNRAEEKLLEQQPGITAVHVEGSHEMISMLTRGEVDAAISSIPFRIALQRNMIHDIDIAFIVPGSEINLRYSIRKDWPELRSIINKAIAAISPEEHEVLLKKWIRWNTSSQTKLQLTAKERAWLDENPVISLGNRIDFPPIGFTNDRGIYSGISADYIKLIEALLDIRIEPSMLESWESTLEAAFAGKVDILGSAIRTRKWDNHLIFTRPYLSYPIGIITRENISFVTDIDELNNHPVAVTAGSAIHAILEINHPDLNLVPAKNTKTALMAVSQGNALAFIGDMLTSSSVISQEGLRGLKISGELPYRYDIAIGIHKDRPLLASIIQKALDAITEEQHHAIQRKWLSMEFERQVDYRLLWQLVAVVTLVLTVILLWNRRLQQEINERRRIEHSLRKERERTQYYLDTVQTVMVALDTNGNISMINHTGCVLLGYAEHELLGQHWFTCCLPQPEGLEQVHPIFQQIINGSLEKTSTYENHVLCKDGKRRLIAWRNTFIQDECGQIIGSLSSGEDITERKAAEDQLKEKKRQLEIIIDNLPAVFFIKDLEGRHLMVNNLFEESVCTNAESIIGKRHEEIFPPEVANDFTQSDQHVLRGKAPFTFEEKVPNPDGTIHSYLTTKAPLIDEQGQAYALIGMATDITKLKQTEEELKIAKEAAEIANQAKSEFLANMSHELRTPMHAILGFTEMGKEKIGRVPNENIHLYFSRILESGQRLMALLNDLLDLSKLEAGYMEFSKTEGDLWKLMEEVAQEYAPLLNEHALTLEMLPTEVNTRAQLDPNRLLQVMGNLISNAIKFTPQGKTIQVSFSNAELPIDSEQGDGSSMPAIAVSIADQGIGIPENELETVFNKFIQSSHTKTGAGGTGLGLAICKEIIQGHGGRIWARNNPADGAVFTFVIPRQTTQPRKQNKATKKSLTA